MTLKEVNEVSIEDIIDKECGEDPMYCDPMHRFKGTKDEWAMYWIEDHMIPSAKDLDLISNEMAMRRVLALAKKTEKLHDQWRAKWQQALDSRDPLLKEIERLEKIYIQAVNGRKEFRDAYRKERAKNSTS